jgi:hypothetical protein
MAVVKDTIHRYVGLYTSSTQVLTLLRFKALPIPIPGGNSVVLVQDLACINLCTAQVILSPMIDL